MRRCPHCQYPNPEAALFCQHCGQALPPVPRVPLFALSDWWEPRAFLRALPPLLVLLCFRLTFGGWLFGGLQRREGAFLSFHLLHGTLFGLGLAWARRDRRWWRWLLLGLGGGLLAEGLEYWYNYQHVVGGLTFDALTWFQVPAAAGYPYRILQALRLGGVLAPLGLGWAWIQRPRLGLQLAALLWLLLGLYLRSFVRGFALAWPALGTSLAWQQLALYAFSALALLYAWGPRPKGLTAQP